MQTSAISTKCICQTTVTTLYKPRSSGRRRQVKSREDTEMLVISLVQQKDTYGVARSASHCVNISGYMPLPDLTSFVRYHNQP